MIDYNHLANLDTNVSIFYSSGLNVWQTWQKPRGCKFVWMMVIGGGGGGGGGQSGTGVGRTGGGGGASSGIAKGMFMANTLPDTLFIQVGIGGVGGIPNGNGVGGSLSYVSIEPNTTATNVLLIHNSTASGAGQSNGTLGGIGSGANLAQQILNYIGVNQFIPNGLNGTSGGANTGGGGTSISQTNILTGGAGGGGSSSANVNGNGGNITMGGSFTTLLGGVGGGTNNGQPGFSTIQPNSILTNKLGFVFTGGSGGGGNGLGVGGNGGNGSFGCGGGGGGAGVTGGSGGKGGDGLVILISY